MRFIGTETPFDDTTCLEVVEQSGGSVVLYQFGGVALVSLDELSIKTREKYEETCSRLLRVGDCLNDPTIINEWDHLEE